MSDGKDGDRGQLRHNNERRRLCAAAGLGGLGLLLGAPAWAQGAGGTPRAAAGGKAWRFLINEAVTGETNFFVLTNRYKPLADYVSEQLKGRHPIGIEAVLDIKRFISLAQAQPRPELVFGKSVNQLAKLVRDEGYHPLVKRPDGYKAAFIVPKNSPLKTLADAGRAKAKILMPDEYAATTAVARAELRRQNVVGAEVAHTRYQEAVAQQVQNSFAQIGVVNPTIAKKWVADGGRVLAETQPVVNWSLLAAPTMPEDTVAQLRDVLMGMNTNTQASAVLQSIGVKEWARAERKDYLALLDYTKE
ncbi:MAG: PhnD/SsuA/transferrin family substrate-binding protein [Pseudomonadota bacterium]